MADYTSVRIKKTVYKRYVEKAKSENRTTQAQINHTLERAAPKKFHVKPSDSSKGVKPREP